MNFGLKLIVVVGLLAGSAWAQATQPTTRAGSDLIRVREDAPDFLRLLVNARRKEKAEGAAVHFERKAIEKDLTSAERGRVVATLPVPSRTVKDGRGGHSWLFKTEG